jgi:myo-inositol-1(or 4)-monophosphatase
MLNIAVRAARGAGNILLRYYDRVDSLTITTKGKNEFVSEVDQAAEQVIIETLRNSYPNHAILAEESGRSEGNEYEWVIDPLDGTTNYLHGFPQFSVSIALKHKGVLEHGVVYDPLREEMFTASRGEGALLNDRRIRVSPRKGLDGALIGTGFPYRDHSHIEAYMALFQQLIQETAGLRRPGSAALDLAYVAAGRLDGFWEFGLSEWDMAAGALLIKEAGGTVTDLSGDDRFLESGNVVAGGLKTHGALLNAVRPHLSDKLRF